MSSSVYPQLYAGQPNPIFNTADFYVTQYIDSLQTNTSTSSSIISNAIALLNDDGSTSNTATEPWVTTQINNAVSTLSGGTLQSTLSTLQQIDAAINNDPNFYTDITASIATVQTNVNTNSSAITALQNRATTDETNITNLQNTKLNVSNPNYTGTMYGPNLNLTGTFTTSGNINANGVSVSPAQISYLGNITSDIQNQLNSKASTSSPIFTGTLTSASIVDNGTFTANNNVVLGTNTSNNTTINSTIVANSQNVSPTQIGYLSNVTSDIQNQINSKASTSSPTFSGTLTSASIVDNGTFTANNNVVLGTNTTNTTTINSTIVANSKNISPTQIGYLSNVSSDLQSQLNSKASSSSPTFTGTVSLPSTVDNGSFTANNGLTVSSGTVSFPSGSISQTAINGLATSLSSKQNTLVFDSVPTSGSSNVLTSGAVYTADANLQSQITSNTSNISTNTSSISSINTTLAGKQNTIIYDSSPTSGSTNIVNSGGIYTALQAYETSSALTTTLGNYLTTSNASSTYQPISGMSSYGTLSGSNSWTGTNNFTSSLVRVEEISENLYNYGNISSNTINLNYSNGAIYYATPQSSTNLTITVTNIPTTNTYCTYTFSILLPVSTYKVYGNTVTINGSSFTPISSGGFSNITVNSSATYLLQQFNVIFTSSSSTPTFVITNALSLY